MLVFCRSVDIFMLMSYLKLKAVLLLVGFSVLLNGQDIYESEDLTFTLDLVAEDIGVPWGMVQLPNRDLLVSEREGRMVRIDLAGQITELTGVPEHESAGQGGLLDLELHPDYEENGWIYLSYSSSKGGKKSTSAIRFRLKDDRLVDTDLIFEALPYERTSHHFGSRLEFDQQGFLYISVGDRGQRDDHPQDLEVAPGKAHRIHADGRIPDDNPFVNDPDAVASIFTWGHRNPQGMARHPVSGEIWTHEHGPRGGDEINILKAGSNYGWPLVTHGINYVGTSITKFKEKAGFASPLHFWVPSIAPCGMAFVTSDRYPGWQGHMLIGSLKFAYLDLVKLDGNRVVSEEKLLDGIGRLRNVIQGSDGYIYVAVENPGQIYRIVPIQD